MSEGVRAVVVSLFVAEDCCAFEGLGEGWGGLGREFGGEVKREVKKLPILRADRDGGMVRISPCIYVCEHSWEKNVHALMLLVKFG